MKSKPSFLAVLFILIISVVEAQHGKTLSPAGKLFIIGGGERSTELMKQLLKTAQLTARDYIVVLPMSSEEPDTAFYYIKEDFLTVCSNLVSNLNFTSDLTNNKLWLDSLKKARLIFITGGDQSRFMGVVLNTPVHDAIIAAFKNGSTIAGTSAGAAVMSKQMITGNEFTHDSMVYGSFRRLHYGMAEVKEGLGLLTTAIIDQHFIARSRYNRLLSVLADYPNNSCIGIDEGTAIIVSGSNVVVTGESQVIRLSHPPGKLRAEKSGLVKMKNVRIDVLASGDSFLIN